MAGQHEELVDFNWLLTQPDRVLSGPGVLSIKDGTISAVCITPRQLRKAGDRLVLPALSNVHDHGRGMRTLAFGAADDNLEIWLSKLSLEPVVDPYLRALVAFGRMAESGIGVLNHCHNTQDFLALEAEAEAVARAANTVGVRVAFAVPLWGANPIAYGDPQPLYDRLGSEQAEVLKNRAATIPSFEDQLAVAESIFCLQDDLFTVQYGPVAPQWVDERSLRIIAERSALHGRRVHMHMLETALQRDWADIAYPEGLVRHLDDIGLLSPRLTIAHGTHLKPDECALLAERGVAISVNTSSNLRLRAGIAPVGDFIAEGVKFGMGMDGMSFDDDEDALREMRLLWRLHRGFGFKDGMTRERLLQAVLFDGREAILGAGTAAPLHVGAPADILTIDTTRISRDIMEGRADILDILMTRATRMDVRALWISGRQVVRDGKLASVSLSAAEDEFDARVRTAAASVDWPVIDKIAEAYRHYYGCGCHLATSTMPSTSTMGPRS
jgi:cytosine/adenosine deaminase-related metal-dependent hydrolase